MAAPCFYTARVLSADLSTLGYERASDPASVSHAGRKRLETLTWLAHVIDPSLEDVSEAGLAAFWDHLGLHSAPKNAAGHCVPLTAAGDKQRERNAAALYLRTAIDLAMAFQRRRQVKGQDEVDTKQEGSEEQGVETDGVDEEPLLDQEDFEANRQLETLITKRHVLFPSTIRLLDQPQGKKRRPLAPRNLNIANRRVANRSISPKSPMVTKEAKDASRKPKTREQILERLRAIQREAQDLRTSATALSVGQEIPSKVESVEPELHPEPDLDSEDVKILADSSKELTKLLAEFDCISTEALAFRTERLDLAKRDAVADEKVSAIAVECQDLEEEVRTILSTARRVQMSISKLVQGRCVVEKLPNSSAVKGVVEYGRRIEKHM